jgi:hypothetical protein
VTALRATAQLLREKIAAVRNAPIKRNRCKIRAILAFAIGPGRDLRHKRYRDSIQNPKHFVIDAYRSDIRVIIFTVGTQPYKLKQFAKIAYADAIASKAGNLPHAI